MFGIKKLFFGNGLDDSLPEDVRAAVAAWQDSQAGALESSHFLTRYVVLDVESDGEGSARQLTGISAAVVHQGVVDPAQSLFIDLRASTGDDLARRLAVFLRFVGKSPVVVYHEVFVSSLLDPLLKASLGVTWQPRWVDLAWLLPAMFEEKSHKPMPLDDWLVAFALDLGEGRRSSMQNTLILARLLQMLIVRAHEKGVDSPDELAAESRASTMLRRTH